MERRETEDIFKKAVYVFLTVLLSLNGYDVVKKENPELMRKLDVMSIRMDSLEQKFTQYIDASPVKSVKMNAH